MDAGCQDSRGRAAGKLGAICDVTDAPCSDAIALSVRRRPWLPTLLLMLLAACSSDKSAPTSQPESQSKPAQASAPRIVFLGDSLTAGLGLQPQESYPALIERRLAQQGYRYEVVNAGVSGDTSAGGLRRLEWSLEGDVAILVVALGANDALRGLPPAQLRNNLEAILTTARARKIPVLLAGMQAPPNNGAEYTAAFRRVYTDLGKASDVVSLPFLLEGVAGDARFNQPDGIHPNAEGAQRIADMMWKALEPLLKKVQS